jgi:hypothetical protein
MFGEKQTRTLLAPADPARFTPVPPPRLSAVDVMDRASVASVRERRSLPRRRVLVMTGATAAVVVAAVVAAYPFDRPDPDRQEGAFGPVVVPIAYQIADDPPPAGDHLRELAARIGDAPYDGGSGAYAYHRTVSWGGTMQASPEGHEMSYVEQRETWAAPDGSGRVGTTVLRMEFPDEASLRYWQSAHPEMLRLPQESVSEYPAGFLHPGTAVPTDPGQLAELLGISDDGVRDFKRIEELYRDRIVPREARAAVLELLADVPGFRWRGEVTDRAERAGVAISYDLPEQQVRHVLVFDPGTGELLSFELIDLTDEQVQFYGLFAESGWTDEPGPTPNAPGVSSPSPGS